MGFGFSIKKLREEAGISVEKLTQRIGVKADRWRKWEEKDLNPRDEDQRKIEDFFKLSLQNIAGLTSISKFLNVPTPGHREGPDGAVQVDGDKILIFEAKSSKEDDLSSVQIVSILARAFDKQADAFQSQAATIKIQAELMKAIEKNMAREQTQATMSSNLDRVLTGVEVLSQDSEFVMKTLGEISLRLPAGKTVPSRDSGKRSDRTVGVGKKLDRKRG